MKTVDYRTFRQALKALQYEVSPDRHIEICDMSDGYEAPIQIGINWSALGTLPVSDAREFAEKLLEAATAAEDFKHNGYTITYGDD